MSGIEAKTYRVNERIRAPRVRVVDSEGKQLGIMPTREALRLAREQGLDLVEVAPNADPPVCKIIDYGRFIYEQRKRQKEAAKKQKLASDLKEVRLKLSIGEHDLKFKIKTAEEFLKEGRRVRFNLRLRGREKFEEKHLKRARELLRKIAAQLEPLAHPIDNPTFVGYAMTLTFAPKQRPGAKKEEKGGDEV